MEMKRVGEPNPDDNLFVQFYMGAIEDKDKSDEAGHPVFVDKPFIKIIVPGDKNSTVDTLASVQYQTRFAELWKKFLAGETQPLEGFPIDQWPAISRSMAEELKYLNIRTVEQMATCADVYGTRIMNFQELRRKAATFLALAKDTAVAVHLNEQLALRDVEIENLRNQIKDFNAKFEALTQTPPTAVAPQVQGKHKG